MSHPARNFGTLGIHLGYDLFDGGRKRSVKREREAQLAQAKENLARLTDEVELAIHTAYNKLERTEQMVKVSEEVVALRSESNRVLQQELLQGAAAEVASCYGYRSGIRREGALASITAGLFRGARRVHSPDGPHTRMTRLHQSKAEHLSHGRSNTPKRLPALTIHFHLVKRLRLRPHKAGEDSWETEVLFAFSTQFCECLQAA